MANPNWINNSTLFNSTWFNSSWQRVSKVFSRKNNPGTLAPEQALQLASYTFAEKDQQTLKLDVYQLANNVNLKGRAAVLYFHGGGFSEGSRNEARYVQFAEKLARLGLVAIPCGYRLTMRGRSMSCDQAQSIKIVAFRSAAEDVWSATQYVLEHADELGISPSRIILAGSSAGAEAVINAAYWKEGDLGLVKRDLPPMFRYAGVLLMAGAILDINWITSENALPTMMFHGENDPLVPYAAASHHHCTPDQPGYLPLYGAGAIAQRLKVLNKPYILITGTVGGHGWADKPMFDHLDRIADFMENEEKLQAFRQVEERWRWV